MSEGSELHKFVPDNAKSKPLDIISDLAPVVQRIQTVLPDSAIWELFSTKPEASGGQVRFPSLRVDSNLMACSETLDLAAYAPQSQFKEKYERACKSAFRVTVWIEVGFEGFDNYAANQGSRDWTAHGHFFATEQERIDTLKLQGAPYYRNIIRKFAQFRLAHGITEDYFTQYGLEHLFDKFS
jgi:hypothetical protein